MIAELHWQAIALRLLLTILAGGVLGFERSRSGHPAGLRTTLLVTLAASVSMIQMNLLMTTAGKAPGSFVVMDLMRLPLGILTGVGFIGAGAIIRKDEMVLGVTTAATMWFATVVGLCLGGGQLVLGSISTIIGFLVLWGIRFGEQRLETQGRGVVALTSEEGKQSAQAIVQILLSDRLHVSAASVAYETAEHRDRFRFEVKWHRTNPAEIPAAIERLRHLPGVVLCEWSGTGQVASS